MKKLLLIVLLIVGWVFGDSINNTTIENQCFQDGYIAGNKFSLDDALIYGVSIYIVVAPITYLFVSKSHPKPKNKILKSINDNCKTYFLKGYEKGSLNRRKSSVLFGCSVLPTALLGAFLIGAITQGQFPPEL